MSKKQPKRRGRPPKQMVRRPERSHGGRPHQVGTRLSEPELATLRRACVDLGVSEGSAIRTAIAIAYARYAAEPAAEAAEAPAAAAASGLA